MKRIVATLALAAFPSAMADGPTHGGVAVPLMLPPGDPHGQSFVRLTNDHRTAPADVRVTAIDDGGNVSGSFAIQLAAGQRFHFNSDDLAYGNADKRIDGVGAPSQGGDWRLSVESSHPVRVQSFVRTNDGFLTAMHDVLPRHEGEGFQYLYAATFNPASNVERQSRLRLINWGEDDEAIAIDARDDAGTYAGPVTLTLPAGHSRTLTAVDLEEGGDGLVGTLGDGLGKWSVRVSPDGLQGDLGSIVGQSLLYAASGHVSNLSTHGIMSGPTDDHGNTPETATAL